MKKNLVIFFVACIPLFGYSQEDKSVDSHFIALYTVGEGWDMDKQPNEQAYFKEHSAFLSKLRKEKRIVIGARYSDTGMIILKAKDLETAKSILHEDLAFQNKLFKLEIHPYASFYKGCIE